MIGNKEWGTRISLCRQNKNMTQEGLAGKLGVTAQAVSKWERGLSLPDVAMLPALCEILEVSSDFLLGLDEKRAVPEQGWLQENMLRSLRNSLEPLQLVFGIGLVPLFLELDSKEAVSAVRGRLSQEGILMPLLRIQDDSRLKDREFMVLSYQNVLYAEQLEEGPNMCPEYIMSKLEETVRKHYGEILNPDITRCLVENLRIKYPGLIEGVVPERISYGLLTEILRGFLARGNGMMYLSRVIEFLDCELRSTPDMRPEEMVEAVAVRIENEKNFFVYLVQRER